MSRIKSGVDYNRRLRAYEMYAGGAMKTEIATALGITRATVTKWAKDARWDERLRTVAAQAEEAVDHSLGNAVGTAIATLRDKVQQRLQELDTICRLDPSGAVRVSAIKTWLELSKKYGATPDPLKSVASPGNLELIQDLAERDGLTKEPALVGLH